MPEFSYEALNEANQTVSGTLSAADASAALAQLQAQGLRITSIRQVETKPADAPAGQPAEPLDTNLPDSDREILRERIEQTLAERELLTPALVALAADLPSGPTQKLVARLAEQLQSGATGEVLSTQENDTATWLALLGRHAQSPDLLAKVFAETQEQTTLRLPWMRVLAYPLFVMAVSLGVFILLSTTLIPQFIDIYRDFDLALPRMTLCLIAIAETILYRPWELLFWFAGIGAVVYLIYWLFRHWIVLAIPWARVTAGSSRQVAAMARFTKRLANGLESGVSLSTALRLAGQTEGSSLLGRQARELAQETSQTDFDWKTSRSVRQFPASVMHALQAGPTGQPSIHLLHELSQLYANRVNDRYAWSGSLAAQLAVLAVGLSVGFMAIALYVPLVSLVEGLTG
jgi:type IV pilus assembly protein PilC